MAFHEIILLFLIIFALAPCMNSKDFEVNDLNMVQMAHNMVVQANNWAQLSAHDESSLIFGHHRRHHGRGRRGGGGGGGGGGLMYGDDLTMDSYGGHHSSDDDDDDSTVNDQSLIFGHHRHHRRHHGGGGGGSHGGLESDDNVTNDGHGGDESSLIFGHHRRHHGGKRGGGGGGGGGHGDDDESTVDESLIFGHHRHHRRHHGGGSGGGGGGHGGLANNDNLMTKDSHGEESSLIFGHHRRHHGGGRSGGGGGGGHGGLTTEDDHMTINSQGGHHGGDDVDDDVNNSTLNDSLILGHHRHHRRHHGGGGGGHGVLTYNDTMTEDGYGGHHGGGRGGHHGGGGHGGLTNDDTTTASSRGGRHDGEIDNDSQTYDNTLIFGRGKHHGGGRGSGGGHHGGRGHDDDNHNDLTYNNTNNNINNSNYNYQKVALNDCAKLYDQAEPLLARLLENNGSYTRQDGLAWLSGALTSHRTCLDGLKDRGIDEVDHPLAQNLTMILNDALLALHGKKLKTGNTKANRGAPWRPRGDQYKGLLSSWNPTTSRADIVVAKDGSGKYRTINEAVNVLAKMMMTKKGRGKRVVVHVKAGVYDENVEIGRHLRNVMFVGEGVDKTIVTARRNYIDGHTTVGSATFRVFGDGFWARDMTFENTAGPQKHQAVALMVASDNALFYKCNIKGYQDTLFAHSLRQFYRDCKIYGTIDFIFGNAAVVFQNCDILVRRPMNHQANMITAQGRDNPYENTGISIHGSRIRPAPEFIPVKGSIKTFLGRPWKKYSRTVIAKSDIDGIIHPKGWTEWRGDFALATLYYAEYMNTGLGSSTRGRVNWPGYHVLKSPREFGPFTVRNFIQGESWVMRTGVPVWTEI